MEKPLFREYNGNNIIEIPKDTYTPIVDSIIHKGDLVMMNGYRKSNKSTFAMQLACNVSSGTPFLGTFAVPKAGYVWYFSTEGKDAEFRERIIRMMKVVPANLDNIILFCSSQFKINTVPGKQAIESTVEKYKDKLPLLIIIDSVYSGFKGSLIDDETVNDFLTAVRYLSELCGDSAMWLTHHLKKPVRGTDGKFFAISDLEGGFGSVFFGGQADHVFRVDYSPKDKLDRMVVCETQRSNKIIEEIPLHLNEPDPFYLCIVGTHDKEHDVLIKLLRGCSTGLSASEVIKKSGVTSSLCYMALNELASKGIIKKLDGYGGKYVLL